MNRRRIKKLRDQAEALAAKKRDREAMQKPCPACGQLPIWIIAVDEETGLDFRTGQPPCERCRAIQDRRVPDRVNVIQFTPLDPADDGYDQDPDGPDPDGPAAAAA